MVVEIVLARAHYEYVPCVECSLSVCACVILNDQRDQKKTFTVTYAHKIISVLNSSMFGDKERSKQKMQTQTNTHALTHPHTHIHITHLQKVRDSLKCKRSEYRYTHALYSLCYQIM